jgi:uncharacterized protein (DUF1330 family)
VRDARHIEPTHEQFEQLLAAAANDDGPVVMVNLLAFAGDQGRESYLKYAAEVQPHLERVGATVLFAGDATATVIGGTESSWWDTVVLVRYPSRAKFLEMVSDAQYQAIAVHRSAALETSGLVAVTQSY